MRSIVMTVVTLALLSLTGTGARADGPWCAYYSGKGSATNCGFHSYAQCLAAISGVGGVCSPNPVYRPRKRNRDY